MKNNRRILIVDDEPYNLLSLQIQILICGYPQLKHMIDTANNGKQAIEIVIAAY